MLMAVVMSDEEVPIYSQVRDKESLKGQQTEEKELIKGYLRSTVDRTG